MSEDCLSDDSMDESGCTCWECVVYNNPDTKRPMKSDDMTDEEFNELIEFCTKDKVIEMMKSERYRANLYQIVPYPLWKQLEDPNIYQNAIENLENIIPDEEPEICHIGYGIEHDENDEMKNIITIAYRFPTSTVKYTLMIEQVGEKRRCRTTSRGSEIKK